MERDIDFCAGLLTDLPIYRQSGGVWSPNLVRLVSGEQSRPGAILALANRKFEVPFLILHELTITPENSGDRLRLSSYDAAPLSGDGSRPEIYEAARLFFRRALELISASHSFEFSRNVRTAAQIQTFLIRNRFVDELILFRDFMGCDPTSPANVRKLRERSMGDSIGALEMILGKAIGELLYAELGRRLPQKQRQRRLRPPMLRSNSVRFLQEPP